MNKIDCTSIIRIHLSEFQKKATAYLFCKNGTIQKAVFKKGSDIFFTKSSFIHECLTQPSPAKCLAKLDEGLYHYDAQHLWAKEKASHHPYYKRLLAHNGINAIAHSR